MKLPALLTVLNTSKINNSLGNIRITQQLWRTRFVVTPRFSIRKLLLVKVPYQ